MYKRVIAEKIMILIFSLIGQMKRLLLLLLSGLALPTAVEACILGNCGSKYEALQACEKWAKKVKSEIIKTFSYGKWGYDVGFIEKERFSRICNHDYGSNKILGIEEDRKIKKINVKKRYIY